MEGDHLVERIELDGGVAPGHGAPGRGGVALGRLRGGMPVERGEPAVRVERDALSHLAAEEVVHRPSGGLALDVPQRDVDPAHHRGGEPARSEIGGLAEEPVPHRGDVARVLADDPGPQVTDGVGDDQAAVGGEVGGLAPAVDARVGEHADEGPDVLRLVVVGGGAASGIDDVDLDVGDLHGAETSDRLSAAAGPRAGWPGSARPVIGGRGASRRSCAARPGGRRPRCRRPRRRRRSGPGGG